VTDSSGVPIFTGFGECLHAGFGSARQGECKDANNAKNVHCMQADRHVFIVEVSGSRIAQ